MRESTDTTPPAASQEVRPGVRMDSRLALWLECERVLVVADLHWGYAASHRARGNLLPAWGDEEIERRLNGLIRDYAPGEMIWLGDTVHAAEGAASAEAFLRTCPVPVTLVAGNHDRRWRRSLETNVRRGRYFLHHGDAPRPVPPGHVEVVGHHHPAVSWGDGAGGNIKLPALVADQDRLVLPAFSPWAEGTNCTDLVTAASKLWVIAPRRIFELRVSHRTSATV